MIARVTADPAAFRALVFPFLQRDPVRNTSILSNVADRANGLLFDPAPPVFVSVHAENDEVVGAVLCTALRGVQLGGLAVELVPPVVDVLMDAAPIGVHGEERAAELFAVRTGRPFSVADRSRLHVLGELVEQHAEGTPRRASDADLDVLAPMLAAYRVEVGHVAGGALEERAWLQQRIDRQRLWLWEDAGRVVAMVGHQSPVFGVVRVGPVYTPPAERGHGYASALTAHVTRVLRDAGDQVCLNTDLANPTSNKIYAAIGYRPVQDFVGYAFT